MANKNIPLKDKQIVTQRLAEGQSTRQAIKGTSINSNQTAARIAKKQSNEITQLRQNYVKQINYYALEGQSSRAAMLADMIWANKHVKKPLAKFYSQYKDSIEYIDTLIEVPDWEMRLKAIKYIDILAGYTVPDGMHMNILQQVNNRD